MSKYEWVHTSSYMVYTSEQCEYAGFRGRQRDAVLCDLVPPSHGSESPSDSEQEKGEPDVPFEDEEFFYAPDADAMEEAISKFGLEQQERRGFREIHTHLQRISVPGSAEIRKMTHAEAIEVTVCTGISQYEMV
jgi:hypothetical protein